MVGICCTHRRVKQTFQQYKKDFLHPLKKPSITHWLKVHKFCIFVFPFATLDDLLVQVPPGKTVKDEETGANFMHFIG